MFIPQPFTLELVEAAADKKDGVALAIQFANIIDCVKDKHNCVVIYFITEADRGSNKGHKLLKKVRPQIFAPSCWGHQVCLWQYCYVFSELINWQSQLVLGNYLKEYKYACKIAESANSLIGRLNNHGKVWKMFDNAQTQIIQDWTGQ